MDYNEKFVDWCYDNGMYAAKNTEMFFLNERGSYRPEYILNNKIFVDIIPDDVYTEKYAEGCDRFRKSFAPIIIIPTSILDELYKITSKDLADKFNIIF